MDVLVVGGGGREAALAWKLAQSPRVHQVWVTQPGPGFPGCRALPEGDLAAVAKEIGVGLVVVGPEAPLVEGLVDRCQALGVPAFGPVAAAARLEASKGFAKDFMARHGIPTAIHGPCVVKADGLAAGKGVYVCKDEDSAHAAVNRVFDAGIGGGEVVIEDLLVGEEVSVLALCDGERFVLLPPAQDHKRRFDDDEGPNTGGMGAYAPAPVGTPELLQMAARDVIEPTLRGMAAEGSPFRGVLYAGLMVTADGPLVLEFNVRFGDPECQPLLALLDEDLLPLLLACAGGRLEPRPLRVKPGFACCVVMVSEGYPGSYPRGRPISGLDEVPEGAQVFLAGVRGEGDRVVTDGGRVLGVTALGQDITKARELAYAGVRSIRFEGAGWREDIASRALNRT
jgi:phosphoribosylamine--glycine ligase